MKQKVVVGLGNPGPRFDLTRHNAGFCVVDLLADGGAFMRTDTANAVIAEVTIEGVPVVLVKPTTFMNTSGEAVAALCRKYELALCDLLIVHDDVSMAMGKLRFQRGGSAGGQHGVESIIEQLGGERGFDRLKLAVGPDPGGANRRDFVLSPISEELMPLYKKVLDTAAQAVRLWLSDGVDRAMCRFNGTDLNNI